MKKNKTEVLRAPSHRMLGFLGFGMAAVSLIAASGVASGVRWTFVVLSFAWILVGHRLARSGAVVDGHTLEVRNPFRSAQVFDSSEIDGFEMGRWGLFPAMAHAILKDGRRVHIWGLQARNPSFVEIDQDIEKMMRDLRAWLESCRQRPPHREAPRS